jgi:hypothetical protein
MRILLTILVSITLLSATAQSHLPFTTFSPYPLYSNINPAFNINPKLKWQLQPYASLSAGYIFLNGGISYLSAPVGVLLFHPLNKNVTAFGGVSAAPTFFSVNQFYSAPAFNSSYLGLQGRIEGGLMYTNDAKTFSISGRVSVERGSYPVNPYNTPNIKNR